MKPRIEYKTATAEPHRRITDHARRTDVLHHVARFEVKEVSDQKRTFTGLSAAWSLDDGGDVILRGAFAKSIASLKSGRTIPLIDQHNYTSVRRAIGKAIDAEETEDGLLTTFRVIATPDGDEVLARVKEGVIDGLSIGYMVPEGGQRAPGENERAAGVKRLLTEIDWFETSAVIWGMNPDALIDTASVKSLAASLASLKRGDLTDDDRKLVRQIASQCGALLRKDDQPPADDPAADAGDGEQQPPPPAAPPGDPADAPKGYANADALSKGINALLYANRLTAVRLASSRVTT